ncbi:uncharacterized protein GGS25DRAFT_514727 [Hypoxylon fragiforme]|uniref:uncharacterized protein n=1 Tax=Hypoxylon fragiforme TaxID=63214 RepID=UPI0020C74790|nr:uncharacterized protein GGS25DRAFT_514727 [Hypoxylon fragiforme]KAI2607307.1 hypothetical protein GGS25DRAFT_514727 [Hypoxylon fragiforme]
MFVGHQPILKVSRTTAAIRGLILITAWAQFATVSAGQTLPYTPTSIFIPESRPAPALENVTSHIAYLFSPQDNGVDLLALNFSSNLHASSLSLQTLTSNVPFLYTNTTAFTPSLADNGSLIVYAGDCSSSSGSEIWTFNPSANDGASASWIKANVALASEADSIQGGPGFLGGSFSFSTTLEPVLSQATTYVYGGMCPDTATDAGANTPQSNATYSNQMITISPSKTAAGQYAVDTVPSKGPPIPEAGFTFTSLSPSVSNRTGVITQQVNYVLLGGHTQYAFINMSTAAIWSLPEESWSFIYNIDTAAAGTGSTELAIKSTAESVSPRSGHTAVLSEDGSSLVILGGWVGDVSQAATPQLAILSIGASYGGEGDWQWLVPEVQPEGSGIYGHGAALLPGNVMMVYGGYSISSTGTKVRRQSSGDSNLPMFLNLTSMSWSDRYTNPEFTESGQDGDSTTTSDDGKKRLGLGLGLGLGFAAIIAAIVAWPWYRRRKRTKRTIRDSVIGALVQDTSRFLPHDDEMMEPGGSWYMGGPDPYLRGHRSLGYQSLQIGSPGSADNNGHQTWYGGMPTQGAKKAPPRRNTYDPPSNSRGPNAIHPIIEADEDGSLHDGDNMASEPVSPVRDANAGDGRNDSDPFLTPTYENSNSSISFPQPSRASLTPSPEERRGGGTTDPEVQDWMSDVEAMDALLNSRRGAGASGHVSPTRRSGGPKVNNSNSNASEGGGGNRGSILGSLSRSGSVRSHLRLSFGLGLGLGLGSSSSALPSPTTANANTGRAGAADDDNNNNRGGSSSSSTAPSYNTAKSSFHALQAEGPSLLLGGSNNNNSTAHNNNNSNNGSSPSKSKPQRRSWLGSLRRVLNLPDHDPSGSNATIAERETEKVEDERGGGAASDYDYEAKRLSGLSGIAAGAGLLRRKSGRGDWEEAALGPASGSNSTAMRRGQEYGAIGGSQGWSEGEKGGEGGGGGGGYGDEYEDEDEEWDIEKAVERRLVQVLFTVPKERLRVVNAEPDAESAVDVAVAEPATSGSGSGGEKGPEVRVLTPRAAEKLPEVRERASPPPLLKPRSFVSQFSEASEDGGAALYDDALEEVEVEVEEEAGWYRDMGMNRDEDENENGDGNEHRDRGRQQPQTPRGTPSRLAEGARLLMVDTPSSESRKRKPSRSPVQDLEDELYSAQAVRLEKPRTRVLAMVQSFESLSREGSPANSPTR